MPGHTWLNRSCVLIEFHPCECGVGIKTIPFHRGAKTFMRTINYRGRYARAGFEIQVAPSMRK